MNKFSEDKIKELNGVALIQSKEWHKSLTKLVGRKIYWTWTQSIFTLKHICPMTRRVWFDETINGYAKDTNAIDEMYLLPN